MTGYLWAALGTFGGVILTVLSDMASAEVRDRLDHLPHAILRLASHRIAPDLRTTAYNDEWLPELTYILRGAETRPITRLIAGIRYALGIFFAARRISHQLARPLQQPTPTLKAPDPRIKGTGNLKVGGGLEVGKWTVSSLTPADELRKLGCR